MPARSSRPGGWSATASARGVTPPGGSISRASTIQTGCRMATPGSRVLFFGFLRVTLAKRTPIRALRFFCPGRAGNSIVWSFLWPVRQAGKELARHPQTAYDPERPGSETPRLRVCRQTSRICHLPGRQPPSPVPPTSSGVHSSACRQSSAGSVCREEPASSGVFPRCHCAQ